MPDEELVLTFDPQTVDHLGARMYSHLPNAIAELVANAYDADATQVVVTVGEADEISVADDGHGMSRDDIAEKYLRIGRNRRRSDSTDLTESAKRRVSGKKGLGKLALFGIGKKVVLTTTRASSTSGVQVILSYDAMMSANGEYKPGEASLIVPASEHGTTVTLTDLKRRTPIDPHGLASSLARLFDYADTGFKIIVRSASGEEVSVDPALRLASIEREFSWVLPENFTDQDEFLRSNGVRGEVVSAKKPLRNTLRGITLYANGRMVNEPEFFGTSESSYAFSYLTGTLDIDFIDHVDNDVIATDRRAIDWEADVTTMLREALQRFLLKVGQEWRTRRSSARQKDREEKIGMPTQAWINSIRQEDERTSVQNLVDGITSDELDLTVEQQGRLIEGINRLAPPNAEFVWRHLHPEIQSATKDPYEASDYFQAVQEAIKRFVNLAKKKASLTQEGALDVVTSAFGSANGRLQVFAKYVALHQFGDTSVKDIEDGQRHLSMGIVAGFRNPLAQEEVKALQDSGAFTFQDCLDALSIISHLVRRLNESEVRSQNPI